MKKLVLIISISFLSTWALAQSCPKPEPFDKTQALGTWQGAYSSEGKFLDITLKVSESNDQLHVHVDMPQMKTKNVAYAVRICDGEELHMVKESAGSSIEFIGKPGNGAIRGTVIFKENGNTVSKEVFTARKTSDKVTLNK